MPQWLIDYILSLPSVRERLIALGWTPPPLARAHTGGPGE